MQHHLMFDKLFALLSDQDIPGFLKYRIKFVNFFIESFCMSLLVDFFLVRVVQCVRKTQILNEVVVFAEKLPEGRPNLDVSSSKYLKIEFLNI